MNSSWLLSLLSLGACACTVESTAPDLTPGSGGSGALATGGSASGGSSSASGGAASAASGGAASGGSGAGTDCSSLPVCDDFETLSAGIAPAAPWSVELGWSNMGNAAAVQASAEQAHSGSLSMKVAPSETGPYAMQTAPPGETFYARAFIKAEPTAQGVLMAVGPSASHGDEIRLRLREGKITLNSAGGGDGLAPDPSNCTDCVATPSDWFCLEMYYDSTTQSATLWVDGTQAASVVNNTGWHTSGQFPAAAERMWFGVNDPGGTTPTVFFDDIALGSSRIGCE